MELGLLLKCVHDGGQRAPRQGVWTGGLREHSPDPREEGVRAQSPGRCRAWEDAQPGRTQSLGGRTARGDAEPGRTHSPGGRRALEDAEPGWTHSPGGCRAWEDARPGGPRVQATGWSRPPSEEPAHDNPGEGPLQGQGRNEKSQSPGSLLEGSPGSGVRAGLRGRGRGPASSGGLPAPPLNTFWTLPPAHSGPASRPHPLPCRQLQSTQHFPPGPAGSSRLLSAHSQCQGSPPAKC